MNSPKIYTNPVVAVRVICGKPLKVRFFVENQYTDLYCIVARFLRIFCDIEASEASKMTERRIEVSRFGNTVLIDMDEIDEYKRTGIDPAEYLPLI